MRGQKEEGILQRYGLILDARLAAMPHTESERGSQGSEWEVRLSVRGQKELLGLHPDGSQLEDLWVSLESSSTSSSSAAHRTTDQTPLTPLGGEARRGVHMRAQKGCVRK